MGIDTLRENMLLVHAASADRLLDLGCGSCPDRHLWKACHAHRVVGVDVAPVDVHDDPNVSLVVANVITDTLRSDDDELFDAVTCMNLLQYVFDTETNVRKLLENVRHALRYHGAFMGIVPDKAAIEADDTVVPGRKFTFGSARFGRAYTRDGETQYIVDMDVLKQLATEHGFLFRESFVADGMRTFVFLKHVFR